MRRGDVIAALAGAAVVVVSGVTVPSASLIGVSGTGFGEDRCGWGSMARGRERGGFLRASHVVHGLDLMHQLMGRDSSTTRPQTIP